MVRRRAFTLVELLVVVAIIALLVSILLPTLGRAKELARRSVCASTVSGYGKAMLMYVTDNKAYPPFSPAGFGSMTSGTYLYPKFYGVLQANKIQPGRPPSPWGPNYGPWAGQPLNAAWAGCWCPNFDWSATFKNALAAAGTFSYTYWASAHPLAMSYQWNTDLRTLPAGRTSNRLKPTGSPDTYSAYWQWFGGQVQPPGEGTWYYTQAISPEEIQHPDLVMEAWDGWDLRSAPNINWATFQGQGFLTPGISAGPYIQNGRVIVNGYRHPGSPNILYADGHTKADATRTVDPVTEGPGAAYAGMSCNSFADWDPVWGNLAHVVPRLEKE